MNSEQIMDLLQWSTLINLCVLVAWAVLFMTARGFVYRMHGRWFRLSESQFDAVHYGGMALFKILWIIFNLAPLLACYIAF